jgi:hypothetical protein
MDKAQEVLEDLRSFPNLSQSKKTFLSSGRTNKRLNSGIFIVQAF